MHTVSSIRALVNPQDIAHALRSFAIRLCDGRLWKCHTRCAMISEIALDRLRNATAVPMERQSDE
jgi:hypothetical protein